MKVKKPVLGHTFPYFNGSIGPIISENDWVRLQMDPYQLC